MVLANWLLSGWIDAAVIVGWMALVVGVGVRAWRRSGDE
jgi:hypothetical protein